jgi:hypothetical protein
MVQIRNRIEQELGREIRIADFFKYPNIASLAGAFSQSHVKGASAGEIAEVRDLAQRQKQALRKQKATMKERLRAHE